MAASLTVTPATGRRGSPLVVDGDGFTASTKTRVRIWEVASGLDVGFDVTTDADGSFSTTDEADPAVGTLTSDATIPTANDTVTIDGVVYTFKAAPTTVAGEVKLGATAATALANLKSAINLTGTPGTDYGSGTVIHPTVKASTLTATTLKLVAKTGGTAGNSLAIAENSTHLSVSGATLSGGSAAVSASALVFIPSREGKYFFSGNDGTLSATADAQVYT